MNTNMNTDMNNDMNNEDYYIIKQPRIKFAKGILCKSGRTVKFSYFENPNALDEKLYLRNFTYEKKSDFDIYFTNQNSTIKPFVYHSYGRGKNGYSDNSKLQVVRDEGFLWSYHRRKNKRKYKNNILAEIKFSE